jgi:hypothetical protein
MKFRLAEDINFAKEGDPATLQVGSDSYPYTVIEVWKGGRQIVLQACDCKRGPKFDFYNNQNWIITPDENGRTIKANYAPKRGRYFSEGSPVYIGRYRYYQDPSF